MKTVKTLLLALVITCSSALSASADKEPNGTKAVAKEVASLLKKPNFKLDKDVLVFVKFTLNDDHEIVVLSVDSEDSKIENYIKKRLNYVKLKSKSNTGDKTFIIPIRMQPEK